MAQANAHDNTAGGGKPPRGAVWRRVLSASMAARGGGGSDGVNVGVLAWQTLAWFSNAL